MNEILVQQKFRPTETPTLFLSSAGVMSTKMPATAMHSIATLASNGILDT